MIPSTSNSFSSGERSALVRSSRKLCKMLGDVPRVPDEGVPSVWHKRKPTHLPPLLKLPNPSVLSVVSNTPSNSSSDIPDEPPHRRTTLERLRRKLGDEVPASAVFSTAIPRSPRRAHGRTRSIAQDDTRSITFSISSDESVHTVTFTAHSPRPHKTKHVYQTGALPSVPSAPMSTADDESGLVRPRAKMAAGSKIGGADFKAARRAKREGRTAEPGEMIEMVGFMF